MRAAPRRSRSGPTRSSRCRTSTRTLRRRANSATCDRAISRGRDKKNGRVERVVDAFGSRTAASSRWAAINSCSTTGKSSAPVARPRSRSTARRRRFRTCVPATWSRFATTSRRTRCARFWPAAPFRRPRHGSAGSAVRISSVEVDATHAAARRRYVHVTVHGTAAGSASFDIGSYVTDLAMHESAPGTYVGAYTIPMRGELRRSAGHRPSERRRYGCAGRAAPQSDLRFEHAARDRRLRAGCGIDGEHQPAGDLCDVCGRCGARQPVERADLGQRPRRDRRLRSDGPVHPVLAVVFLSRRTGSRDGSRCRPGR